MKKIISAIAIVALVILQAVTMQTQAHAAAPYCKSGYSTVTTIPMKSPDGFTTLYYVAVFKNRDATRIGVKTYGHPSHSVFVKLFKGTKTLKSDHGIGKTSCETYPWSKIRKNSKGERWIGVYGSDSREGALVAKARFKSKYNGA